MSLFWYPRHQLMISPKKRRDQDGGDPKTMARKPKPHYRYMFSFSFSCWWLFKQMSSQSFRSFFVFFYPSLFFVHQVPSCISSQSPRLHASNPNLSTTETNTQEVCPESPDSPTDVSRLQEDFCRLANNSEPPFFFLNRKSLFKCLFYVQWQHRVFLLCFSPVHATLKSTFSSLVAERDRLRHTIDLHAPQPGQVMGLKTAYASVSVSMTQKSLFRMITPQIPLSPQV